MVVFYHWFLVNMPISFSFSMCGKILPAKQPRRESEREQSQNKLNTLCAFSNRSGSLGLALALVKLSVFSDVNKCLLHVELKFSSQ